MSQRVVQDIGNYIGEFVESDSNNFVGVWREYLRVRVSIPLDKPLKRRMKLRKNADTWCWVNFRYEGVPTFCFICGRMGHNEKFCERIFDTPLENIERPYGIWMKAEPRRRNHVIGSKWLRQGGQIPATSGMTEMEGRTGKKVIVMGATSKHDPVIVGAEINTGKISGVRSGGNNNGAILVEKVAPKIQIGGHILNENKDGEVVIDHGLVVMDPKHRRVEETDINESAQTHGPIDVTMTETYISPTQNQKNETEAGAAMQARLGL